MGGGGCTVPDWEVEGVPDGEVEGVPDGEVEGVPDGEVEGVRYLIGRWRVYGT